MDKGYVVNPIKKEKDNLREEYISRRREMSRDIKKVRDDSICEKAVGLMSYRYAEYILLYAATEDEIDVRAIAEDAWANGKKVAFPKCDKETHTMKYHFVSSYDELSPDAYGLLEPSNDAPVYDPESSAGAVCFVPGLLYDKFGYRLGYGKGFYDRYLTDFTGCTIGVIYSDYIVASVPRGRFDVTVDVLLTEKGVKPSRSGSSK